MESHFKECPPRTNILVVDNNITTLLNMKKTITQCNYQVMIETNGERALAFLRNSRHEINIVIWDLHMSGVNGIQALKVIGSEMDLPVIIMSDDHQCDSVMEAIYHGACDFVLKPVSEKKIAFIWQHIVRKKMKSTPVSISVPVQSNLVQSGCLDQVKDDSTRSGSDLEHSTEIRNEEKSAKNTTWTEVEIRPFQSDLVQRIYVDQQNEDYITTNQDNSEVYIEEKNEAKKPRTEETQVVQTDRLQTESLDQDNAESCRILSEDNNDEGNIENKNKKRARRPRMIWTGDLHQRFLEAIEIVGGIENANPRLLLKCMDEMRIKGLTRHNVASHLQKYRVSLEEAQIAKNRAKEFGSSLSLHAPNNLQTASSSYLLNGQAMSPMQKTQYQSGSLTMNNNQFITDPDQSCYLTTFPFLDCLRDPRSQQYLLASQHVLAQHYQPSNQEQECQSSYRQQPYQLSNQQHQYLSANEDQPYQSSYQKQQYQSANLEQHFQPTNQSFNQLKQCESANQQQQHESANQQQQYESANHQPHQLSNQQLQYQSANQELQYQADNQQHEYPSANQKQENQSAKEQFSDDISATDVELIYPRLPYDPKEYFRNGHNFNQ